MEEQAILMQENGMTGVQQVCERRLKVGGAAAPPAPPFSYPTDYV